jgi:hypothetical protein
MHSNISTRLGKSSFPRDRATLVTNTILGVIEDAIKTAVEDALSAAHAAISNALRDEFADLTRQVINENRSAPESE